VRELEYDETEQEMALSQSVFDDVARTRTSLVIFPNMHTLNWKAFLPLCVMFMHSNVKRFVIYLPSVIAEASPRPFFDDIINRMPRLNEIDIRTDIPARILEKEFIRLLPSLPDLQKLSTPRFFLTSSIAVCLSHLPKLGCIEFQYHVDQGSGDPADIAVFQPELPEGAFPSLQDLSLTASYLEAQRFLTIPFAPTNLTILYIESSNFESSTTLHQLLAAISENCQMLKRLTLISPRRELEDHTPDPDGSNQVTADTLKPVLSCCNLTSFEIVHQFPFRLTQKDLEVFAKCWVSLETLNLNSEPHHFESSHLTLEALFPFAQYCPRLSYLALFIDASITIPSFPSTSRYPCFKCLQQLTMGLSVVREPVSVACFLSRVLPLGCQIDSGVIWTETFELEPRAEATATQRCSMWYEVNKLLPMLIRVREEERERMKELQRELGQVREQVHDLTEKLDVLARSGDSGMT